MLKKIILISILLVTTNLNCKELDKPISKQYTINGQTYHPLTSVKKYKEVGIASWYGEESGKITANGERFDTNKLTAAHKTLPFNSLIKVTNLENHKNVMVRVSDRGPFRKGRIIDLSRAAARKIGITGTAHVQIEFLRKV